MMMVLLLLHCTPLLLMVRMMEVMFKQVQLFLLSCFVVRIANLTTAEIATNNYVAQLGTKFRKIGAEGG